MATNLGAQSAIMANGRDLSGYLNSIGVTATIEALENTTFKSAKETGAKSYRPGLEEGSLSGEGFFEADTVNEDALDDVLAATRRATSVWTVFPDTDAFGFDGWGFEAIRTSYEISTPVAELAKASVDATSNEGAERVDSLHALAQELATGNGTDLDNGAATSNGGVGYVSVSDVSPAESVTVKVQHSVDGTTWVDLITFTVGDAAGQAERIEVAGTVNRHVRATWSLSGGNATFQVAFGRK